MTKIPPKPLRRPKYQPNLKNTLGITKVTKLHPQATTTRMTKIAPNLQNDQYAPETIKMTKKPLKPPNTL